MKKSQGNVPTWAAWYFKGFIEEMVRRFCGKSNRGDHLHLISISPLELFILIRKQLRDECNGLMGREIANTGVKCRGVLALVLYYQMFIDNSHLIVALFKEIREANPRWAWPKRDIVLRDITHLIVGVLAKDLWCSREKAYVLLEGCSIDEDIRTLEEELRSYITTGEGSGVVARRLPKRVCDIHPDNKASLSKKHGGLSICGKCRRRLTKALNIGKRDGGLDESSTLPKIKKYVNP